MSDKPKPDYLLRRARMKRPPLPAPGTRFGLLTVRGPVAEGRRTLLLDCACGNTYETIAIRLSTGQIKSCGCHAHVAPRGFIKPKQARHAR